MTEASTSGKASTPPPIIQGIQPPTGLIVTGKNKAVNWKVYKQQWHNYSIVQQLEKQTEEYRVALFLYSIGPEAVKTYNSFDMSTENRRKISEIIKEFDSYAIGETNETYERHLFNCRDQKDGENIDAYVTELRTLAQSCNFCACSHDSLIRDRIVLGIRDGNARRRLLRQSKLTLQKCIEIVKSDETSSTQMHSMDQTNKTEDVHKVKPKNLKPNYEEREPRQSLRNEQITTRDCGYCGRKHRRGRDNCPAWGKTCTSCGKKNHFAKICRQGKEKAHQVEDRSDDETSETEFLYSITMKPETSETINGVTAPESKEIYANMLIDDKHVKFHVDCGATVNILPKKYVNTEIRPTKRVLQMWNKTELKPEGVCRVTLRNPKNKRKYSVEFLVVRENLTPLLGAKVIQQMGLIEVHEENFELVAATKTVSEKKSSQDIIEEYNDVFEGELGTLEGEQQLEVDPTVTPHISPSRRVPFSVKPKLKAELERLTDIGVVIPVDEPTDWVSNLVIATKESGDLRLCLDPQHLNKALKRERYPIPVVDDVLPDLAQARVFTKVDARNGYWHVQLDDKSSRLTTFDTPFGRYRWKRLPFGLNVSAEMFQKRLNQTLDRLDGLLTVHDDMVIYGVGDTEDEARSDHNAKLRCFLQRCREKGVKLNKKKLKLECNEINYLGHVITANGLKPDPDKVEAVRKMPKPDDVKAVRRFCGFVNYLAKFLPRLAETLKPIQQLTHSDVPWQWHHEHETAFNKVKELVTAAPLLRYYKPDEELTIQCDASEKGMGAALMQSGQPIAFASRALTETETRYAQIEKEMLAVVFALQKFDQYAYGRSVTVQSDHKPLSAIIKKPLRSAPKRLQGMLLKIQRYDVDIVYKPGQEMYLADTLSRAFLPTTTNTQGEFERINAVKLLPMTQERLDEIKSSTREDEVIQQLKEVIQTGWPDKKQQLPPILAPYYNFRDELSVYDGLVFKGEQLLIPKMMRAKMKERLHSSHIGINGCLRRARECLYWPGMAAEVKEYVSQCEVCSKYETRQQKETLMSHEMAERPWEKIGTDIYTIDGSDYLITVDYFSNFWEIDYLADTKASTIIKKLKCHFARQGIPDSVISDNGPQFACEQFGLFSKQWGFEHQPSSPGHQQANGKAEAAVKQAKKIMRKAKETGGDIYLSVLAMRNTPTESMESSPAQRLLGRRCKTLLPATAELLKPCTVHDKTVIKETRKKQEKQAQYYNRGARDLPPLEEGDTVRMRPFRLGQKGWETATVIKRHDERSYEVETDTRTYRRNRADLREQHFPNPQPTPIPQSTAVDRDQQTESVGQAPTTPEPLQQQETSESTQRPKRTIREPAYLKDYVQ